MKNNLTFGLLLTAVLATGCGGGSKSSSGGSSGRQDAVAGTDPLNIGTQVALVDASSGSASNASLNALIKAAVPTSGAYITDEAEVYTEGAFNDSIDIINEILCYIDQSAFNAVLDSGYEGNYIALIDGKECRDRGESKAGDSTNQSSGADAGAEIEEWTVNVTARQSGQPQVVLFWVPETGDECEGPDCGGDCDEIRAKMTIYEGKGDCNPYGRFSMDFVGINEDGSECMTGNLSISETDAEFIRMQFIADEPNGYFSEAVNAIQAPPDGCSSQTAEAGSTVFYSLRSAKFDDSSFGSSGGEGEDEGEGEEEPAMSVTKEALVEFTESMKGATNSTHALIDFDVSTSNDYFGEDETICLDRNSFDVNVWEYCVYSEDGSQVDLNGGIPIRSGEKYGWADYWGIWFDHGTTVTDGMTVTDDEGENTYTVHVSPGKLIKRTKHSMTLADLVGDTCLWWDQSDGTQYEVAWDGTNFSKVATETCSEMGCTQTALETPVAINFEPFEWFGCWKEGLGNINVVADENGDVSNEEEVPYYSEDFITPTEELTLKCGFECLKCPLTADDLSSETPFETEADEVADMYTYTIDSDLDLTRNNQSCAFPTGEAGPQAGSFDWGVRTGAMVTTAVAATLDEVHEVWGQDESYIYETGPNEWNQSRFLTDSNGEVVEFDSPLHLLFDSSTYGTFFLEYAGDCQLWGIPWVEQEEGSGHDFWVQQFALPDGTELTSGDGTKYYSRQMVIEQHMTEVPVANCSALSLGGVPGAPDVEYTDNGMSASPTVDVPPCVSQGELQAATCETP